MMRQYIDKKIFDLYHLNFVEFIELPKDVIEMMLHVGNEENSRRQKQLSEIENSMGSMK